MTEGSGLVNRFVQSILATSSEGSKMRRNAFIGFALVLATGCAPLGLYYKEGKPVDQLSRDQASCKIEALKVVPVEPRTRIIPGTLTPRTYCNAAGACDTIWVKTTPDRLETYDVNEGTRREYANQCMAKEGYQYVRLPPCPNDVVENTQLARTTVLPPINNKSCAIRLKSGAWQMVNPPG